MNRKNKRRIQNAVSILWVAVLVISTIFQYQPAKASVGNPYPQTYSDGEGYHPGNCTWQVWEEAYTRLGIQLPNWGNAGGWCNRARTEGYTVVDYTDGAVPPDNCIIEWSGHVAWVLSADSVGANIREGNIKLNGAYQAVHEQWWSWEQLRRYRGNPKGFIILNGIPVTPVPSVSFTDFNQNGVWDTNAEMYTKVMNPNREAISAVGCYLYDANGALVKSYTENCSYDLSYINYNCNINNDMKYTLMPGTTYKFELFAVVGGKEYKDVMRSFTTTGNSDQVNPVITDVSVYDLTETGYKVRCIASDNVGVVKVQFPTWTDANGQDDIQAEWWDNPTASGGKDSDGYYVYEVKISDHNNELGIYHTHIYAYDNAGNSVCVKVPDVTVWSEIQPEVTPDPIPDVTSEPVPDITPEPVPDITPEPVPDITPEPVPDITPEPVPNITPAPVPNITPVPGNDYNYDDDYDNDWDASVTKHKLIKKPGKVTNVKIKKSGKKCAKVTWGKVKCNDGYQIQYSLKKSFSSKKTITNYGRSTNIYGKSKKTYYVRIRAVNWGYISQTKLGYKYGGWSTVKKIKLK